VDELNEVAVVEAVMVVSGEGGGFVLSAVEVDRVMVVAEVVRVVLEGELSLEEVAVVDGLVDRLVEVGVVELEVVEVLDDVVDEVELLLSEETSVRVVGVDVLGFEVVLVGLLVVLDVEVKVVVGVVVGMAKVVLEVVDSVELVVLGVRISKMALDTVELVLLVIGTAVKVDVGDGVLDTVADVGVVEREVVDLLVVVLGFVVLVELLLFRGTSADVVVVVAEVVDVTVVELLREVGVVLVVGVVDVAVDLLETATVEDDETLVDGVLTVDVDDDEFSAKILTLK